MLKDPGRLASGLADFDDLLGGLMLGDNVVWVSEDDGLLTRIEDALLSEALSRRQRCYYVTASRDVAKLRARLHPDVVVLDAGPRGAHRDLGRLAATIIEGSHGSPPGCVVVDALDSFSRRWGGDRAVAFFGMVCPQLFDLGALAYWRAPRSELSRATIDRITQVTQCVLEIDDGRLRVCKAEGRPAKVQGALLRVSTADGTIRFEKELGLGRLGRGLERLRRDRNLTQTDLARLLGVSPSAISQAESGRRGLSVDTLLVLSESLGVSLDQLLSASSTPDYVLARRPRGPDQTKRPLLDDCRAGLRAFQIRLAPGESAAPDLRHKGQELVLVASGLVQVGIGSDTPVMRAGDAALVMTTEVTGWRNIGSEPAVLFWVLRD